MALNLRPINNDVIVRKVAKQQYTGTSIYLGEDVEDDQQKFFEVLAVSPKVTSVKVGDVVIVPWTRVTDPVEYPVDGVPTSIGITDEKEILAVVEW